MTSLNGEIKLKAKKSGYTKRWPVGICLLLAAVLTMSAAAAAGVAATIYIRPACDCCMQYVRYLREAGVTVTVVKDSAKLREINEDYNIPAGHVGCHTMLIDGYVVSGHVPIAAIRKLLAERPDIDGISLAGMPQGSPGMSGTRHGALVVYAFGGHSKPQIVGRY